LTLIDVMRVRIRRKNVRV